MTFIFTCPCCGQQFSAPEEMIGQNATCRNCGAEINIQKQLRPITPLSQRQDMPGLILGILSLILWLIPLFSLPLPIIGFIMSYNRNYRLGIILNSVGLGLSILWTIICVLAEME